MQSDCFRSLNLLCSGVLVDVAVVVRLNFPNLVSDDDNGDGSENVAIKMKSRFVKRRRYYSNLQGKFPGVELLEIAFKLRKRKTS